MSDERYGLLDALQGADEQMIYEAGQPWTGKKRSIASRTGVRAACALLAVIVGTMGIFHEQVATAIENLGAFMAEYFGNTRDLESYISTLNQTQTDNGISMTLQEVIMDQTRLIVCAEIAFDEEAGVDDTDFNNLWAYVNSVWIDDEYLEAGTIIGVQTENTNRFVMQYPFDGQAVSEDMGKVELQVQLADSLPDGMNERVAQFDFSFAATREQLQAQTTVVPLDQDMDAGDGIVLHLKDLAYTDIGGRLRVGCSRDPRIWHEEDEDVRWYDVPYSFEVEDDQGNLMTYDLTLNYDEEDDLTELVFDSSYGNRPADDAKYLLIRLYRSESVLASERYQELGISKEELEEEWATEGETDGMMLVPRQVGEELRIDL